MQFYLNKQPMMPNLFSRYLLIATVIMIFPFTMVNSAPLELSEAEKLWLEQHKEITIYSGTDVPPLMFPGSAGEEPKGIAIDYVKVVLSKLGITPHFSEPMPFAAGRAMLEQEQGIDLIPLAAITPGNKKRWALTTPFHSTPLIVFSRTKGDVITDIEQFEGRKIAYFKNAKFVEILKKKYKSIEWAPYDEIRLAFDAVASGKADGVIAALTVGAYIINQNGLGNLKVATTAPLPKLDFTFAVHKNNDLFAGLLSKAIDSLSPDEKNVINKKWLPVRFDHGLTFIDLALWVIIVAAILSFVIIIFVLSNSRLKKEIKIRKQTETELIHAKELADSANNAKSVFLSVMSHELRTPLTAINGTVALAKSGVFGQLNDKGKSFMEVAHRNCERLECLINDLLDMEKITSGRLQLNNTKSDLEVIIREALELNESYAKQYNVNIIIKKLAKNVHVDVDKFRLVQVLSNFISNACKFSEENSVVTLNSEVIGKTVRVSVHNEGPIIKEDFKPYVFDKFSQADLTDTRSHSGSGLGLAISKEMIESMKGEIGFESEQGKGTTFYFDLQIIQ